MDNEQYWKVILEHTDERIIDLGLVASSKTLQGAKLRWIHGLIETNKQWKLIAEFHLNQINLHRKRMAELSHVRLKTFRGNDDDY